MIIFTKHALKRMNERGILRMDMAKVIKNPDYIQRDFKKIIANKKLNGKVLEMVFIRENKKIIILTCYYL